MAFSLDDMLERLGLSATQITSHRGRECYREEAANISVANRDEIAKLFPNVTLSNSKEVVYAPFRHCHSLPKVNLRGRCFTPRTLHNSFASVRDALVNVDHQMNYRKGAKKDTICGHIVCGRFDPEGLYKGENEEQASVNNSKVWLPASPIPIVALAAFYLRSQHVPDFLEEHLSGKRRWHSSMECNHDYEQASFYYRNDFIPIRDADEGMRECVEKLKVRPYKGHDLSLVIGGLAGKVDFHSVALTPTPADQDAKLLAFVTKDEYVEAASRGDNVFFLPLETKIISDDSNVAEPEDMEEELANISILGKSHPAEDGHAHDVLNDGTIVPHGGHAHYMATWAVTTGTNPRLTGRTDTHSDYVRNGQDGTDTRTHMHMIDIPLRGKRSGKKTTETSSVLDVEPYQEPWTFPSFGDIDMTTKPSFNDVMGRFSRILGGLKLEGQAQTEVASLRSELELLSRDEFVKSSIKTEIANLVASGDLVEKPKHEEAVKAAVAEETKKHEAEKKENDIRTARREKVVALGIDLDSQFNEKSELKVGDYLKTFALDDSGNAAFEATLATWETLVTTQKELAEKNKPAADPSPAKETLAGTETTAANIGKSPATPGKAGQKKKLFLAVGGGGEEEASTTTTTEETANAGKKAGKFAFSTPLN